jgi:hypothetical protein
LVGSLSRVPGRYHLDKSVHEALAAKLRRHGLDVTTAAEAGLIGASAAQSLAYAAKGRRVLISFDPVFLSLHETDAVHANIIHVRDGKKIWNAEVLRVALRMAGEIAKP